MVSAIVTLSWGRSWTTLVVLFCWKGYSLLPGNQSVMPNEAGYMPVIKDAREGEET